MGGFLLQLAYSNILSDPSSVYTLLMNYWDDWCNFPTESDMEDEGESAVGDSGEESDTEEEESEEEEGEGSDDDNPTEKNVANEPGKG